MRILDTRFIEPLVSKLLLFSVMLLLQGCTNSESEQMQVRDDFFQLVRAFEGLTGSSAPDAFLVVTITATQDFLQFTAGPESVQLDFPLITDRQREARPRLERVCAELGLIPTIQPGSDGSEFLTYDIEGTPVEIATIVRILFERVYDVVSGDELTYETNGFTMVIV